MQITVEIPDEITQFLDQSRGSLSRRLLEVIIADAYDCGKVNTAEVRQILNLPSRLETHAFLKRVGVYLNYESSLAATGDLRYRYICDLLSKSSSFHQTRIIHNDVLNFSNLLPINYCHPKTFLFRILHHTICF